MTLDDLSSQLIMGEGPIREDGPRVAEAAWARGLRARFRTSPTFAAPRRRSSDEEAATRGRPVSSPEAGSAPNL